MSLPLKVLSFLFGWKFVVGVTTSAGLLLIGTVGAIFFGYLHPDVVAAYPYQISQGGQYAIAVWGTITSGLTIRTLVPMLLAGYGKWQERSQANQALGSLAALVAANPDLVKRLPELLALAGTAGAPGTSAAAPK